MISVSGGKNTASESSGRQSGFLHMQGNFWLGWYQLKNPTASKTGFVLFSIKASTALGSCSKPLEPTAAANQRTIQSWRWEPCRGGSICKGAARGTRFPGLEPFERGCSSVVVRSSPVGLLTDPGP